MARSYGTATLTLTVTEAITLNSKDEGQTHSHTISSIADIYRRTMTVGTGGETAIATFSSVFGAGQFVAADTKYIRITNLDNTNYVAIFLKNQHNDEVCVKVDAGQSFIVCADLSGGVVDIMDANTAGVAEKANLGDLSQIRAQADTGAVDIELYMAMV